MSVPNIVSQSIGIWSLVTLPVSDLSTFRAKMRHFGQHLQLPFTKVNLISDE